MLYRGSLLGAHKAILGLNFRVFLFWGDYDKFTGFPNVDPEKFFWDYKKIFYESKKLYI